eukprot:1646526-Prymnesium_polylepis.1
MSPTPSAVRPRSFLLLRDVSLSLRAYSPFRAQSPVHVHAEVVQAAGCRTPAPKSLQGPVNERGRASGNGSQILTRGPGFEPPRRTGKQ